MNHLKTGNAFFSQSNLRNYKYNGKELQETGMYDYHARQLMVDVARFLQIDPLADKMPWVSTYAYAFNNPIRNIDPTGREPEDFVIGSSEQCCGPFFGGLMRFMPLLEGGSNVRPSTVVELAKTGETTGRATNEHHLIPKQFKNHEIVKQAREEGYKFEGKENKLTVEKYSRATGEGRHANHPKLNKQIKQLLDEIPKSEALNGVRKLRDKAKDAINDNPETKLNDLELKQAPRVKKDNININKSPAPVIMPAPKPKDPCAGIPNCV